MFGFDESRDARDSAYNYEGEHHESHFTHELIAGAAGFEGMKLFEDHQRREGKEVSHSFAKELIAGFAAGEVDKLAETKGLDFIDRERAQHEAKRHGEQLYDQQYGQYDNYNPQNQDRHGRMDY